MSARSLKPQVPAEAPELEESKPQAKPPQAPSARQLRDESEVDPASIPYGQTVMSNQGHVCSTQERKK